MFKKPFEVQFDNIDATVTHTIQLDPPTARFIRSEVDNVGAHARGLIVIAGIVTTASAIAIHIAKTKIK